MGFTYTWSDALPVDGQRFIKAEASAQVIQSHQTPHPSHRPPSPFIPYSKLVMPARTIDSSVTLQLHRSARDVPPEVCAALGRDPRSNIILPKLESCRASESRGYKLDPDEFWIVCSTRRGSEKVLDFMLSCTYGITGKYPVFIYSPKSESDLTRTFIDARVELMVAKLLTVVSTRRVYSVFANDAVARSFASCWKTQTGISAIQKPYYAALFSLCTPATLTPAPMPNGNLRMRPALPADAAQIAVLCRGFAEESVSHSRFKLELESRLTRDRSPSFLTIQAR